MTSLVIDTYLWIEVLAIVVMFVVDVIFVVSCLTDRLD